METERLILDRVKETDKEDYFHNISHDKKVLETFVCRYAASLLKDPKTMNGGIIA